MSIVLMPVCACSAGNLLLPLCVFQVWLILDGMVLDVGRWLPEHPGGASIIPKQSLNLDCARFFEVGVPALQSAVEGGGGANDCLTNCAMQ